MDVVRDKETHVLDVVGDKVTHVSCVVSRCLCAVFLTRPADSSASCTACAQQLLYCIGNQGCHTQGTMD